MQDRHGLLDTIAGQFAPIHPDGHRFILVAAAVTLVLFLFESWLGWIGVLGTAWMAYFFRDPERVTPLREGLVVSAADGRISAVDEVIPPRELDLGPGLRTRISVFLSVFDVHVNRSPIAAKIVQSVYVPGLFLNAELDKASEENERRALTLETAKGERLGVVQIAGLIARRIVTFVDQGHNLAAGERIGLIRFGSRVDVYLPPGAAPLVAAGQIAIGGETVLADLRNTEPAREARAG